MRRHNINRFFAFAVSVIFIFSFITSLEARQRPSKSPQEIYSEISDWLIHHKVEMPIAKTFPIHEFKEAYRFAKKGGMIGKVVFTIQ